MSGHEDLKRGEVVCKLSPEETEELKRVCAGIESIDQSIHQMQTRRMHLAKMRTDCWEKIFNKYLLTRGAGYNINWETGELMKI